MKIDLEHQGKRCTPLEAIRKHCLQCMGENQAYVRECEDKDCPAWAFRMGRGRVKLKTIRELCLECAGSSQDVKECTGGEDICGLGPCALWIFRLGTNPNISERTRKARSQRAQNQVRLSAQEPQFCRENDFSG